MKLRKLQLTFRRPRLRDGPLLFCCECTSFEATSTFGHCCFVFVCVVCGLPGCCPFHRPAPLHDFSQLSPAFWSNPAALRSASRTRYRSRGLNWPSQRWFRDLTQCFQCPLYRSLLLFEL